MGVPAALQVTLQARSQDAIARNWSLPVFLVPMKSASVMMGTGQDTVMIRSRVANALNIQNNDVVDFFVEEIGETWQLGVKIRDDIQSDVIIHDLFTLRLAISYSGHAGGSDVQLVSGKTLHLKEQEMWAGMKIVEKKGSAKLFFDGASQNNPCGPCGYGFHIGYDGKNDNLVKGSVYAGMNRSSNEMEYEGLIEGLIWATRLDLQRLDICGDSELIIKQVTGEYSVRNHRLRAMCEKVQQLLRRHSDLQISFQHISRGENQTADGLANAAILSKSNVTSCSWPNINKLMAVSHDIFGIH